MPMDVPLESLHGQAGGTGRRVLEDPTYLHDGICVLGEPG